MEFKIDTFLNKSLTQVKVKAFFTKIKPNFASKIPNTKTVKSQANYPNIFNELSSKLAGNRLCIAFLLTCFFFCKEIIHSVNA